jgi:hypothetical protein
MKKVIDIDLQKLGLVEIKELDVALHELHELYGLIWCEAAYDPDNEITQKFARKLLPHIKKANEVLKFKK